MTHQTEASIFGGVSLVLCIPIILYYMCKTIIFQSILDRVEEETEIPRERILSQCKRGDVVEARCLLFYFMRRAGFYPSQIARTVGCSRQSVNRLLQTFDGRSNMRGNMLSIFVQRIGDALTSEGLIREK